MKSLRAIKFVPVLAALSALCGAANALEYGTVVSSTPVIGQSSVPQRECYDEQVAVQQRSGGGGGAIVGAVIGGLVGNSVGAGAGRAAATALGVVTGAAIGDRAEADSQPPAVRNVQRCRTTSRYEDNVIGYDVVYDYAGTRRTARLAQNPGGPGTQIVVDVSVSSSGGVRYGRNDGRNGAPVPPVNSRRSAPVDDGAVGQPADQGAQTYYYEDERRYAPAPVYYQPAPVYYQPYPAVVVAPPTIWIGGSWGSGRHRHHHHR